jgi:hypothetical protein
VFYQMDCRTGQFQNSRIRLIKQVRLFFGGLV